MQWLWVAALVVGASVAQQLDSDSLRGALEVINKRQHDLANPSLYYVDHFKPPIHGLLNEKPPSDDDGQPEELSFGYQKSFAPKTDGLFEAVPLPESELGSHSSGVSTRLPNNSPFDAMILDYIEDNLASSPRDSQVYGYQPADKRSVFRERDIHNPVNTLQDLFPEGEFSEQYFENGEHHQQAGPSMFRERVSSKPPSNYQTHNAQTLVRHFGGLDRDTEQFPGNSDDPDEYLSVLNSVWDKYQDSNSDNVDPEDLSETDVEEILDYLNHKQEKKKGNINPYERSNEFFNSPLAWVKRDRQRLSVDPKQPTDQFLHALKFLNGHIGTFESTGEEDIRNDEQGGNVARLLMEEQEDRTGKRFEKRFWRGNSFEEHHQNKRFPVTKRSSIYTSPAVLYSRAAAENHALRRKKNIKSHVSDSITDPKIAQELNNIFSPSDNPSNPSTGKNYTHQNHSTDLNVNTNLNNKTEVQKIHENKTKPINKAPVEHSSMFHNHKKRSGQKEETIIDSQHKHKDKSKKNVDWSNYFGIDRRRKKSLNKPDNDEWLLDQYLKAYSLSARAIEGQGNGAHEVLKRKSNTDDMDAKLQGMEDMIVDQVLKYTGAHEGITDSEEIQAVKDRVIAQLAAAYSLEKMRKALKEFKSSMAAQKTSASGHTSTKAPIDVPEIKEKRVAVKKEKAVVPIEAKTKKNEADNSISLLNHAAIRQGHNPTWNEENSCPVMDDISQRCKEIATMAGDDSQFLLPLCSLHQVCYMCGPELGATPSGCDFTFLSESNSFCGSNARCRYLAHRTVSAMHSLRGDPSPLGCDWRSYPCLARYLAATLR